MVFIQNTQTVILRVPVRRIRHFRNARQIIQPIQFGNRCCDGLQWAGRARGGLGLAWRGGGIGRSELAGAGDDAAEEEVDVVGFAGAEGAGEFVAGEGGDGGDVERVAVAGGVEGDVCLDVFCELD